MKAKIHHREEIAKGTLTVFFKTEESFNFTPGQYAVIEIINPLYTDEKGNQRFFSIVNTPQTPNIIQIATRMTGSAFKRSLQEMPEGSEIEVKRIMGNFVLPEDMTNSLVFLSGGIGITPFVSMLRHVTEEQLPYKIHLFYSNKDKESTAFYSEIIEMEKQNPNLDVTFIMTQDSTWEGESRHIDADFIKERIQDLNSHLYYVVGPPTMVEVILQVLTTAGVEEANIKKEKFSGY